MLEIFRKNRFFVIPYLILLFFASVILITFSKGEIHIFLNQFHHPVADKFFMYVTYLGDGLAMVVFIVILLFVKYRYSLIILSSVFFATIIVQFLKRVIYAGEPRPMLYFKGIYQLYFVPGERVHQINSFPSGHTATAFGLFFMAALITSNNSLKLLYFVAALLVAISRIYLSQHFLVDTYFGSLIGVVCTGLMFYFGMKWRNPGLNNSLLKR